jgi:hypothetical protein
MDPTFTKAQRRRLRELARIAYERELSYELERLESAFQRWHSGEMDAFALAAGVHEFHQEVARDLYSKYEHADPEWPVAHAIHRGLIRPDETDATIVEALAKHLASLREQDGTV